MLDKTYQPATVEDRIYKAWEENDCFKAGADARKNAEKYCICIPPPNVTGSLHMGHALNNTLQDILCRYQRMQGKDVLWQPGTDHAGIATQLVVEKQLAAEGGPTRQDMGREAFLERVWNWKEESGGTIINQLKRLGASCDWSRERFTMDEGLSAAVLKVFVELHEKGLIYKDKRLVNWDPVFRSAISDLEVKPEETNGHLWHFKYPLKDDPSRHIIVATTRPETMLGDTAIAVHPDDERFSDLIGKSAILPLVGREITIVADDYADPEQGSGAVKITPAHDFNDFEVGKRHDLEMINIFTADAKIISGEEADQYDIPEPFRGLDRFDARKAIVDALEADGLLDRIDDHALTVPRAERGGAIVEPYLTEQWFVNASELAKPAIKAVENGETKFVPENWSKTYFEWMRNIQPWCISRQLWWGHQIPAWYDEDGNIFVALDEKSAHAKAAEHHGKSVELTRDPDVLDTWFSSALWPFSTLGWPDDTAEVKSFYPTNDLVTGFDIIFFWVARMMMFGKHFMGDAPFDTVYIHALVRDESGVKMSKTLGNVIDPLELIEQYGADALRFTLAAMAAPGRDIKLATSRVEGYRNFATKLWNASRFAEMNECARDENFDPKAVANPINRWIISETEAAAAAVQKGIENYRFNDAASAAYQFTWGVFCDWYLELIKPILAGHDEPAKTETRATASWALDAIYTILHPFMPFITEELWARVAEHSIKRQNMLASTSWPQLDGLSDEAARADIDWVIRFVTAIRSVRAEMNVPEKAEIPVVVIDPDAEISRRADEHEETLKRLARLEGIRFDHTAPKGAVQIVLEETTLALPLGDVIDIEAEVTRLKKQIDKAQGEISGIDKKLANKQFVSKAPAAVVDEQKQRRINAEEIVARLEEALKRLASLN